MIGAYRYWFWCFFFFYRGVAMNARREAAREMREAHGVKFGFGASRMPGSIAEPPRRNLAD